MRHRISDIVKQNIEVESTIPESKNRDHRDEMY